MIQDFKKQPIRLLQPQNLSDDDSLCFNVPLLYWKNESHHKT